VLKRLPKILIVLALASSIGLHWAFLQAVAWTGMVISYSQDRPVTEAVSDTFDGNHPCKLCKEIATDKRTEKKSQYKFESSKVKFAYKRAAYLHSMPAFLWEAPALEPSGNLLTQAPPSPPPRSFIG